MRSRDEFQSKAFRTLKAFLEGTPVPVVEHGGVLVEGRRRIGGGLTTRGVSVIRFANGFGARATDGGLRPPTAISVEPNGIPTRPTDDVEPIPVGDEADAAPAIGVLALPAQAPEVPPDRPPPSNSVVEPEVPAVDIPVLKELPGIEGAMPGDTCESEPPPPEHVATYCRECAGRHRAPQLRALRTRRR